MNSSNSFNKSTADGSTTKNNLEFSASWGFAIGIIKIRNNFLYFQDSYRT